MIGIVILNYQTWEATRDCIESIAANPPTGRYQIILVDNASPNKPEYDLEELVARHNVIYLHNEVNKGYNAGNNVGIARALELGCEFILISNNDVQYHPGAIQTMRDYLQQHPGVGIVGPKVIDCNGIVQRDSIFRRTGMREKYLVRTRIHAICRNRYRSYFGWNRDYDKRQEDAYSVLGCCFMMSAKCAGDVTPLDEYPFLYEEELILGIRMEEAGYRTVYEPAAVVSHLHGESTGRCKAFSYGHNVRSELYYCREYLHAKAWQVRPLYCYRTALYLLRCIRIRDFRQRWRWYCKVTGEELRLYGKSINYHGCL